MLSKKTKIGFLAIFILVLSQRVRCEILLPNDLPIKSGCTFPEVTFLSNVQAKLRTQILTADTFPDNTKFGSSEPGQTTNCDFFIRAERMFRWVTSRQDKQYVFDSPSLFYDVWHDATGKRFLIPSGRASFQQYVSLGLSFSNNDGLTRGLSSSMTSARIFDSMQSGYLLDKYQRSKLLNQAFASAMDYHKLSNLTVNTDSSDSMSIGEPPGPEPKVLMTRGCKVVYYLVQVNDVFAYFHAGVKSKKLTLEMFPTTEDDVKNILAFVKQQKGSSYVVGDSKALAVTLKSAWLDVTNLKNNQDQYITIKRFIRPYDVGSSGQSQCPTPSSTVLIPGPPEERTLGLLGMHVVFSLSRHPEMLWSTFEHVGNAPNDDYDYSTKDFQVKTAGWLFWDNMATVNQPRMHLEGANIRADNNKTIGPSHIVRRAAWGGGAPAINTEIMTVNKAAFESLPQNDIRRNYLMIGATWIAEGSRTRVPRDNDAIEAGSTSLVNTTMETFYNRTKPNDETKNGISTCFDCHHGPEMLGTIQNNRSLGLSHLFGALCPLDQKC